MIKVNLLPLKRKKKKAKPLQGFIVAMVLITVVSLVILSYAVYFFNSRLAARQARIVQNEKMIEELSKQIKAVENYEKLNSTYQKHKEIIEQLGKNKTLPVKVLDEVSSLLPVGVWLNSLDLKGRELNLSGTGFTNSDVVSYVNNLKAANIFSDVYLQESVQTQTAAGSAKTAGISTYGFKISFKVKE